MQGGFGPREYFHSSSSRYKRQPLSGSKLQHLSIIVVLTTPFLAFLV